MLGEFLTGGSVSCGNVYVNFNYMYITPSAMCLCDNMGLVLLILLGWELRVISHNTVVL